MEGVVGLQRKSGRVNGRIVRTGSVREVNCFVRPFYTVCVGR